MVSCSQKIKKVPGFSYSLFILVLCFTLIIVPVITMGVKINVMFLLVWLVAIPLCMRLGYTYKELQDGILKFIPRSIIPVLIILSIGSLIAAWSASGTVAAITMLGLKIINPQYFMITAFLVTLISAIFTGTSFGTVGTVGVALMGVAIGMGISPTIAAGAILSAAIIGDGLSPLASTPNVIAGVCNVDMFKSLKFQLPVTIPVILVSLIIYGYMGVTGNIHSADSTAIQNVVDGIASSFHVNFFSVIPVILVFAMLICKVPAIPSIISGSLFGLIVACFNEGLPFNEVVNSMWSGYTHHSANTMINTLFSRGGISGMTSTCVLMILSFGLFGILYESKVLDSLVKPLVRRITNRLSGVICVLILGFSANISSSNSFSEVFTGSVMSDVYEKVGLNKFDLVRAATVGCVILSMYVPFTVMASTVTGFLGVDPFEMVTYYVSPPLYVIAIIIITAFNLDKKMFTNTDEFFSSSESTTLNN